MAIKLTDLAEKLDSSVEELTKVLDQLGFDYDKAEMTVEDDLAELLEDELGTTKTEVESIVEQVEVGLERDIVKKQRKKTAGKESHPSKQAATHQIETPLEIKVKKLEISEAISVKELAEKTGINAAKIIGELMKNGIIANINQQLDYETAALIASEFGVEVKKMIAQGTATDILEKNLTAIIGEEDQEDLQTRPPIITIMGHVDHGKTKLLDTIRQTHVMEGESGGITQHIGAYQVIKNGKPITFIDTPGHEAFTEMRARGARITDIAVLVVSAIEGVKPTTIEAINHAKEANVPIMVAINKMDLPNANPDKIKAELAEYGLQPEEWGGQTIMVNISALTGQGVDQLLDMILLLSDVLNLKANPDRSAVATVVETHLDPGLGPVATIIVNTGTLHIGDFVVVGDASGKIKVMQDNLGKRLTTAGPSTPVIIAGISKSPQTGDILQVVKDDRTAREQASHVTMVRSADLMKSAGNVADIVSKIKSGELKVLKLIIKTDTKGSFEAIKNSLEKIHDDEVMVKIIHSGVGNITESDVMMAKTAGGLIFGFHVDIPTNIVKSAERAGVTVKLYKIIYNIVDDVKNILSGLLSPEILTVELGKAEVRQIFFGKKKEMIIGVKLTNGVLQKNCKIRILRNNEIIGEGQILMIRRVNEPVEEIKADNECGLKITSAITIQDGDILEAYKIEQKLRTLA